MCWEPLAEWGPLDSDFGDLSTLLYKVHLQHEVMLLTNICLYFISIKHLIQNTFTLFLSPIKVKDIIHFIYLQTDFRGHSLG
jgi:hypothetical protein